MANKTRAAMKQFVLSKFNLFRSEKSLPINVEKRFGRGKKRMLVVLRIWHNPPTIGYTSYFHSQKCNFGKACNCSPDNQLFFSEYDDKSITELFNIYTPIVNSGRLPLVLFVATRPDGKHWHCVSPCFFSRAEKVALQYEAQVSPRYIGFATSVNRSTLRIVKKDGRAFGLPYTAGLVCSPDVLSQFPQKVASATHLEFMRRIYEIPDEEFKRYRSLPLKWVKGRVELDRYAATNIMRQKGGKA